MRMKTRPHESIIVAGLILLCVFIVLNIPACQSVLAQEQIKKYGEIAGGHSDSIPFKLTRGEMIIGEVVVRNNQTLRLSVADFSGNIIYDFGLIPMQGGFYYAAETDGQHYLLVTNPDSFSVGTRGYAITYAIEPSNVKPGAGSGQKASVSQNTPNSQILLWVAVIIIGLIASVVLISVLVVKRRKKPVVKRRKKKTGRFNGLSIGELNELRKNFRSCEPLEKPFSLYLGCGKFSVVQDNIGIKRCLNCDWED